MTENETKLRRAAGTATGAGLGVPQYAPVPAADSLECLGKMDGAGIKDHNCHNGRYLQCRARLIRFLHRRGLDIFVMLLYFAMLLAGHVVTLLVLCEPSEAFLVQILRPVFLLTSFLFNASWLGVVYHGPGCAPPASSEEVAATGRPPPALAAALEVGRFGRSQQFNAEVMACSKCDRQKSPLAHHCSTCNRCVSWMDHHCYYMGTCVGFRNMRCFFVWLNYGVGLAWILNILTLHKVYQDGLPQSWRWCLWGPWFWFLGWMYLKINLTLQFLTMQLASGYHSQVMMKKFRAVHHDGIALNDETQARTAALPMAPPGGDGRPPHEARLVAAAAELAEAVQKLQTGVQQGHHELLWGPFLGKRLGENLPIVFGSQRSWRWLLPLVPGGTGNPCQPASWCVEGCNAWARLGTAMEGAQEALKEDKAASGAMQLQIEAFLNGHNAFCA